MREKRSPVGWRFALLASLRASGLRCHYLVHVCPIGLWQVRTSARRCAPLLVTVRVSLTTDARR
jgi:hypothetical protein